MPKYLPLCTSYSSERQKAHRKSWETDRGKTHLTENPERNSSESPRTGEWGATGVGEKVPSRLLCPAKVLFKQKGEIDSQANKIEGDVTSRPALQKKILTEVIQRGKKV